MAVTITCRMATGISNPIVEKTAVHIEVHGLDPWTADPQEDDPSHTVQAVYRIFADGPQAARDDGWSHAFTPSADGDHEWDGYIFPTSGSYTLRVYSLNADGTPDSEIQTQAVTVAAS